METHYNRSRFEDFIWFKLRLLTLRSIRVCEKIAAQASCGRADRQSERWCTQLVSWPAHFDVQTTQGGPPASGPLPHPKPRRLPFGCRSGHLESPTSKHGPPVEVKKHDRAKVMQKTPSGPTKHACFFKLVLRDLFKIWCSKKLP